MVLTAQYTIGNNPLLNYVVCLKWGDKYSSEYVNKLNSMVKRHLTLPYEFVCFTDDPDGIDYDIRIEPLPSLPVTGWWFKPYFFNPELVLTGTILFLDLDIIVFKNIDYLFTYNPGKFCIIRDFNRHYIKNYNKFNSSVFRLNTGDHPIVYNEFIKNAKSLSTRFRGDQDWIRHCVTTDFSYWPDDWIQSYKWEMRGRDKLIKTNGKQNFKVSEYPTILKETSIAVFHGEPNPHDCIDKWCKRNWG